MDITSKQDAKIIGDAVREALEKVAADLGLTVKVGGGRYDPTTGQFMPKVEFSTSDSAQREFAMYAGSFGLEAEDYGRSFQQGARTFTLSGIRPKARKQPIVATEGGKTYIFTCASVLRALGREVPEWLT